MKLQQAIFASARTASGNGYQLVARSRGILDQDAQELAVWGPSHDSLSDAAGQSASVNFLSLPSGAVCVSKTSAAGAEYSGRGGQQVYTQCFVLERDQFARFSNNPFAVLKALTAQGSVETLERPAGELPAISLLGRASVVDIDAVTQAERLLGARRIAGLVQAALAQSTLAIVTSDESRVVLTAALNCLPVECRTEFSLTTGLKFSPQRPFRLSVFPAHGNDARRLSRVYGLGVFDLTADAENQAIEHGWARLVLRVLEQGRVAEFRQALTLPHPGLECEQLDELGRDLLALFERQPAKERPTCPAADPPAHETREPNHCQPPTAGGLRLVGEGSQGSGDVSRRTDGVHIKFNSTAEAQEKLQAAATRVRLAELSTDPADVLGAVCPQAQAQLELLDDTVFDAIAGKTEAMRRLANLWPQVVRELGPDLLEESQVQYLRHALAVWRNYTEEDAGGDPQKASRALDVLCLLLDEAGVRT